MTPDCPNCEIIHAKPSSLKNIAFDTGVLFEQRRILQLLEKADEQYPQPSAESEALWEIICLIKGEE